MLKDILTPQKLKSELEHANLSQIAKRYGVSKQYMTQVFAEYRKQYPHLFPETYPSKEWLENALKQKTILGICNETGLSYHRIRKLMDEYGIPKNTVTAMSSTLFVIICCISVTDSWGDNVMLSNDTC